MADARATDAAPRVAVLRNQFLPYSETFIHDELRCHERYAPTVLARREIDPARFPGHRVVAIETSNARRPLASLLYGVTGRSRRFDRALAQGGFSLLHAHFGHNGAYALGFARRHRLPLVVSLHGHDVTVLIGREKYHPDWWFYLARYRRLLTDATLFLAASDELRELVCSLGCPESKVRVHRLGVDFDVLERHRSPEANPPQVTPPQVTMVGRFVEKKGHEFGIRAAALAARRGHAFRLVIIGGGPLEARYRELIRELEIPNVELTGPLPHAQVLEQLARSAAVLAPSVVAKNLDRESGMLVAKEDGGLGVPVVGTRHGGLPEIVEHGRTGFLVGERDAEALAAALSSLLGDPELRARVGAAAREKIQREYDLRVRVRALEALYDEAVEIGRAGAR